MTIRRSAGFSVMEMLVVLFIIGIILSMIGPKVVKLMLRGRETSTEQTLGAIKNAILEYQMELGSNPKTLQHLVENVDKNTKWKISYLDGRTEVPLDAWSRPLIYNIPPKIFTKEYKYFEIFSYGANGENADSSEYIKQGS